MKRLAMFFTVAILLTIALSTGNVLASENGKQPRDCMKRFTELDSSHKGYLDRRDFVRELEGPSKKIQPYGKVTAEFAAADRNGDGIVTPDEFCAWLSHKK